MKEDTVARMDRLEDMFHLVIQKKDSEIEGFKKTVNEMKLKIADLEFSLENANDRFEGVQLGESSKCSIHRKFRFAEIFYSPKILTLRKFESIIF